MAPDLFSFLDNAPPEDESDNEVLAEKIPIPVSAPVSTSSQKRKSSPGNAELGRLPPTSHEVVDRPVKRLRAASPVPVVVDEFQTEAKREMAASGGLTGAVEEGSRLELRHQVCEATRLLTSVLILLRSGIKSPFLPATIMFPLQNIFLLQSPFGNTNSHSIRSSRFRCMLSSGMRVFWYRRILAPVRQWWQSMP